MSEQEWPAFRPEFEGHIGEYDEVMEDTDKANGERMEALYGEVLRRIKSTDWRSWDRTHWGSDDGTIAKQAAQDLSAYMEDVELAICDDCIMPEFLEGWLTNPSTMKPYASLLGKYGAITKDPAAVIAWAGKSQEHGDFIAERLEAEQKDQIRRELEAWIKKTKSDAGMNSAISQFGARVTTNAEDFNQVRTKFAFQNGEIDTRTGIFSPGHNPEDLNTRVSPYAYNPDAKGEYWPAYLGTNIPTRAERKFIQMCMGYAMSGDGNQKIILVMYSVMSDTGKSIFVAVMKAFFGKGYAASLAEDTIVARNNRDGGRDPDRMALRDKRLSLVSEMDPKKPLDVRFIKQYTGGDEIATRDNHAVGGNQAWTGEGLMLATTNHLVHVNVEDPAFWERMMLVEWKVPFPRLIPGPNGVDMIPNPERDEDLVHKIIGTNGYPGEMEYVSVWVAEGLRMYIKAGRKIVPPRSVIRAIAKYRDSSDAVKLWLQEAINDGYVVDDEKTSGGVSQLHKMATEWGRQNKIHIPSNARGEFTERMRKLGYHFGPLLVGHPEKDRFKTKRRVHGLSIPDAIKVQFKLEGE